MEYIRVTKENLEKEHISFAVPFPTIKIFKYHQRRHGLRIDLMKVLCFLRA